MGSAARESAWPIRAIEGRRQKAMKPIVAGYALSWPFRGKANGALDLL
jgi:hypothetical protein